MFYAFISWAYRKVLIVSALALLGYSAMSAIACLNRFAMVKGGPLTVVVNTMANSVWPILLSLVSCAFLVKKARQLTSQGSFSALCLFAQILSIIGLFLVIPWLYHLMSASYSWQGHMLYGLGTPFAFWVYMLAAGIILHEVAQMPPFKIEMKKSTQLNRSEVQRPYGQQKGDDNDILFP